MDAAEKHPARQPREEAVWRLAERLHWKMEHLDPTVNGGDWDCLSEHKQDFYRLCIEDLLTDEELIRRCVRQ